VNQKYICTLIKSRNLLAIDCEAITNGGSVRIWKETVTLYLMTLSPEITEYSHRKIFVATHEDLVYHGCKIDAGISRLTTWCNVLRKNNRVGRLPLPNCKRKGHGWTTLNMEVKLENFERPNR
jgi:hypothetical protein